MSQRNRMVVIALCALLCSVGFIPLASQEIPNDNLELLGQISPRPGPYSDIWGYAAGGREYCILGHFAGTYIFDVTDPEDIREIAFFEGAGSIWRDIKIHDHYAYVVHDANFDQFETPGMQIIDLSDLPQEATLVGNYTENMPNGLAHNLYIDNGIAYVVGGEQIRGALILDLSDPVEPQVVNTIIDPYYHDIIVNNDIIFASAVFDGEIHILDGSNLNDIQTLSVTAYPGAFTHNIWMTDDNQYFITTNERNDLPINFWDATDLTEPVQIASYTAGPNSVPHNAHIKGDFAYVSYYNDGLKIFDISNRGVPVEVANYDSFPDDSLRRNLGLTGNWGAYPYLPSGNILISDTKYGLLILDFQETGAGYLEGRVLDAVTEEPLSNVEIEFVDTPINEGAMTIEIGDNGAYGIGSKPQRRDIRFSKFGFHSVVLEDVEFVSGVTTVQDIHLEPLASTSVRVQVQTTSGEPAPNIPLHIVSTNGILEQDILTDENGTSTVTLFIGEYTISVDVWGFLPKTVDANFTETPNDELIVELDPGYVADLVVPHPDWIFQAPGESGLNRWRFLPIADHGAKLFLPVTNRRGDSTTRAAFSRATRGNARLETPLFNGARLEKPTLAFFHYYNPFGYDSLDTDVKDTLLIEVSADNGETWHIAHTMVEAVSDWTYVTVDLENSVASAPEMKIRFNNIEGDADTVRTAAFCLLDEIRIVPAALSVGVEERLRPDITLHGMHYPNPTLGNLAIEWRQPAAHSADIMVYSLTGNRVARFTFPGAAGMNIASIDLEGLNAGVYFYRIIAGEFVSSARKVELVR